MVLQRGQLGSAVQNRVTSSGLRLPFEFRVSVKTVTDALMGTAVNLRALLDNVEILTILIISVCDRGRPPFPCPL